jgi:hypothetical protein
MNKHLLERVIIKWLNKYYSNLTQRRYKNNSELVFYVDSKNIIFMEYNKNNGYVWVRYSGIWHKIKSMFNVNDDDVELIMKQWIEETYKLEGVTPGNTFLPTLKIQVGTYKF